MAPLTTGTDRPYNGVLVEAVVITKLPGWLCVVRQARVVLPHVPGFTPRLLSLSSETHSVVNVMEQML